MLMYLAAAYQMERVSGYAIPVSALIKILPYPPQGKEWYCANAQCAQE